jgi:hypothetical protein
VKGKKLHNASKKKKRSIGTLIKPRFLFDKFTQKFVQEVCTLEVSTSRT